MERKVDFMVFSIERHCLEGFSRTQLIEILGFRSVTVSSMLIAVSFSVAAFVTAPVFAASAYQAVVCQTAPLALGVLAVMLGRDLKC